MTLLSEQEQRQVADAITRVERETDAELVTVLAGSSDDYSYIPVLWAAVAALIVPGALNYIPGWLGPQGLLLAQWGTFIVLALIFRLPAIGYRLVPRSVRHWRASNMARRQFLEQNLHHTENATGMLIFVSEAEHYVEILVDEGIASRIGNDTWCESVEAFTRRVRQGQTLEGFLACIDSCGEHLKKQVPATHARNELPNHLVILP